MMHGSGCGGGAGDHFVVPESVMSLAGLEGSGGGGGGSSAGQSHGQKQQHVIWEWEAAGSGGSGGSHQDLNASAAAALHHDHAFFPGAAAGPPPPYMDCPAVPPLLPMNSFPFYLPPPPLEYQMGFINSGDGDGGGGRIIGLNLGHRTYFSPGDHALSIDWLISPGSSSAATRGLLYPFRCSQPPRCQAEGCKVDLSGAKHYHRRHKVCELHSKAAAAVVAGLQQRFCQQCSRFHVLAEFDDAKRSCRKRLADHNRRRRKPPPPPPPPPPDGGAVSTSSSLEQTKSQPQISAGDGSTVHASKQGAALLTLSGGGIAAEKEGTAGVKNGVTMHQAQGIAIKTAVGDRGKLSEEEQQRPSSAFDGSSSSAAAAASAACFHHHNLFCSSSHATEAAAADGGRGGGSGWQSGAGSDHQHPHIFGLGHQSSFEVDYM